MARKKKTEDEERQAIQDEPTLTDENHVEGEEVFPPTEGPMAGLPVFGQVIPKGAGKLALQSEAQRRSVAAAKTSAAERTLPLVRDAAIDNITNVLNQDLTEKLTESVRQAKVKKSKSGEFQAINTQTEESEDTNMAAKKKTAKKKSAAKKTAVAREPGRARKLLLRLSVEEYDQLQAKAAKQEVSMAHLLRSSALA